MKHKTGISTAFASRGVLLEESGSPFFVKMTLLFGVILIAAFLIWASHLQLSETTTSPGILVPAGRVVKVQHPLGGVVSQILVFDGQFVDSGDVLVKLDPRQSASLWHEAQDRASGSLIRKLLLSTLLNTGTLQVVEGLEKQDKKAIGEQTMLVNQELVSYRQTVSILRSQRGQASAELLELDAQEKRARKQKSLLEEEISARSSLVDKGLNSKLSFLALQRTLAEYQGTLDQLVATRSKLNQRVEELTERLAEADSKFKENLYREIAQIDQDLVMMRGEREREQLKFDFSELRAPYAGLVNAMAIHSTGEVIAAGQKILELIPVGAGMFAEVKIGPAEIGHVKQGQHVVLKFSSYDFNRYGGMNALLEKVSPSTIIDEKGNPYYGGIVKLSETTFKSRGGSLILLPGMQVQADICTGNKTLMEYLLKPFYATRTALRER